MFRSGSIVVHDSAVNLWEEDVDELGMYQVFRRVLARMSSRGWTVQTDPDCVRNYPTLAKTHWVGRRGDLEALIQTSGRHLELCFFQSERRYAFGKLQGMPRHMRTACLVEMCAAVKLLVEIGYNLVDRDGSRSLRVPATMKTVRDLAEDSRDETPLQRFNRGWGSDRFERGEDGWPTVREYDRDGSNCDLYGEPLRNGQVKYLMIGGRLQRATVYTNMNSMWMVCYGGSVTYVSGRELFDCDRPDLVRGRRVDGQMERLARELKKATESKLYRRAATLSSILARMQEQLGFIYNGLFSRDVA